MNSMQGKVAVVTGGSSGIGLATALAFAANGANVVIGDVQDGSEAVQAVKQAGSDAIFVKADVSKSEDVRSWMLPFKPMGGWILA